MRKLPLIFLPLLLITLSACSRSPSPPTAEPPVLATQPTEQTTIPPEQINEPGQESSSQPVTEPMPEPTAPPVTEPASTAAAADTPPNTADLYPSPRSLRSRLPQSHRQHPHSRSQQQNRPPRRRRRSRQKPHSTSTTGSAMRRPSPRKRGWFWNHRPWTAGTTPSPQIQTAFTWSETSPPD